MTDDIKGKKLEQIQSLIAMAESTQYPDEADAFMAKAQELMTKFQIDEIMLGQFNGTRQTEVVETRCVKVYGPHTMARAHLLGCVARANTCKTISNYADDRSDASERKQGQYNRLVWVTGFPTDIDNVLMLFASLNLQMAVASQAQKDKRPQYISSERWNKDFMLGFARGVSERLTLAADRAREAARVQGLDYLPVLRNRAALVNAKYQEDNPSSVQKTMNYGSVNFSNGKAAGQRSDVGGSQLRNRQALHA